MSRPAWFDWAKTRGGRLGQRRGKLAGPGGDWRGRAREAGRRPTGTQSGMARSTARRSYPSLSDWIEEAGRCGAGAGQCGGTRQ